MRHEWPRSTADAGAVARPSLPGVHGLGWGTAHHKRHSVHSSGPLLRAVAAARCLALGAARRCSAIPPGAASPCPALSPCTPLPLFVFKGQGAPAGWARHKARLTGACKMGCDEKKLVCSPVALTWNSVTLAPTSVTTPTTSWLQGQGGQQGYHGLIGRGNLQTSGRGWVGGWVGGGG